MEDSPIEKFSMDLDSIGAKADIVFHSRLVEMLDEQLAKRIDEGADISTMGSWIRGAVELLSTLSQHPWARKASESYAEYDLESKNDLKNQLSQISKYFPTLRGSELYRMIESARKDNRKTKKILGKARKQGINAIRNRTKLAPVTPKETQQVLYWVEKRRRDETFVDESSLANQL